MHEMTYLIHKLIGHVIIFVIDECYFQRKREDDVSFVDLRDGVDSAIPFLRFEKGDLRSIGTDFWNPWASDLLKTDAAGS